MAKAKKLEKFTDEELLAPLPALTESVSGLATTPKFDFAAQKNFLEARINQVLSEELDEKNLERIKILKKGVVSWRTSFDKEAKAYIAAAYKAPMDLFKAATNEVLAEIDTMESKLDEVLDKEERKRIDNLNVMIDGLIEDLQDEYKLPDNYLERIERRKSFYNKTAVAKDTANDLRAQFADLAKEYKNYQLAVKTITNLCKSDKRLNVQMYIDNLKYHDLAEVMDDIEKEQKRLAELDAPVSDAEVVQKPLEPNEDGIIEVGIKVDTKISKSDFPGITKTMTAQITYPVDVADDLTRIFAELRKQGIKMKVISVVENAAEIPKF